MNSLATGTAFLTNSTCLVSGNFYKPATVLDAIAKANPTVSGVIVIEKRGVTGRIGVSKNRVITGGVVEETGETGTPAICKLLLLPYASFSFRQALPQDRLHLEQELNLSFEEVTSFLSGPSSIGLACPTDHALNNLRSMTVEQEFEAAKFSWESTSLRSTYRNLTQESAAGEIPNEQFTDSGDYGSDCSALRETVVRKRKETAEILMKQGSSRPQEVQVLVAGPLPSRKRQGKPVNKALVGLAVTMVLGVVAGVSIVGNLSQFKFDSYAQPVAEEASVNTVAKGDSKDENLETRTGGTAPFIMPSGGTAAPAAGASSSHLEEPPAEPVSAPAVNMVSNPGNSEDLSRCLEAVRNNPTDAGLRKQLAFAYLVGGHPTSSIEQFYAVKKLQPVDSSEVITFANNLLVFGGKDLARQFLTDNLKADPSQNAIRERLNSL